MSFDFITIPIGYVLRWCNNLVGNQYLFALLLFAIIVEVLLLPFGIKQQKNSIRQARLKPKEMAIRKKYAGREDKQTQQMLSQEIQEMYQKENVSPLAGCLPMLIQLPIIMILYNIVLNPLKYICRLSDDGIQQLLNVVKTFPEYAESLKNATSARTIELMGAAKKIMETHGADVFAGVEGFAENIPSVDAFPNLTLLGMNLADIPSFQNLSWLILIPFLTFGVYFLSMKITRKLTFQPAMAANDQATGCSNKMMDFTMPLMSAFIAFSVPAALGVYWIFKSIISTVKQFILHKAMPFPTFTEEDYKAAEREVGVRGKGKAARAAEKHTDENAPVQKSARVGAVRSLHHIDDEDFEDTKERAERAKAAMAQAEEEKAAEAKKRGGKISLDDKDVALKKDDALRPEGKDAKKREESTEASVEEPKTSEPVGEETDNTETQTENH